MSIYSLQTIVSRFADSLVMIDKSGIPFRNYSPGVGPYGEPQLLKKIAQIMNFNPNYKGRIKTKREPDILIKGYWAIDVKLARPYGDNGKEAENWSVNLLHPYEGNQSALGDCEKLLGLNIPEKKAVVVIGYEHDPPKICLQPLIESFEVLAKEVMKIHLGSRITERRKNLIHPVHQQLAVNAWEVLGRL